LVPALAASGFLLAQLLSMPPLERTHFGVNGQDFTLFSSAFAAGRGGQSGRGNGGGAGQGNNGAISGFSNFGPNNAPAGHSFPASRGLRGNGGGIPAETPLDLPSGAVSPGEKLPDLKFNDKSPVGALLELDELKANAGDYLGRYPPPGLAFGKGNREQAGKKAHEHRRRASVQRSMRTAVPANSYMQNEVLARNLSRAALDRAKALGFAPQDNDPAQTDGSITSLTIPTGMTAIEAVAILESELPGEQFHLNRIYRLYRPAAKEGDVQRAKGIESAGPDDALCKEDRCYGRQAIGWKDDLAQCAGRLKIGIIDTDVDIQHTAFAGQEIVQETFLPDGRRLAGGSHGTGTLALLAGRRDSGTPGLLPDAAFYVASIFFAGDDGEVLTDTVSLLRALDWMSASDVRLVNMSFSGPQDDLVEARIRTLRAKGMVFAAAAGNEGLAAEPSYPAAYSQVIAVTAVDKDLKIYPSASRGAYIDLAAPGVHVWTALPNSQAGYLSGTSFAVPFMTAVLAIQRPETLRLGRDKLLDRVKTLRLGAAGHSRRTYGRGLLQAPSECPSAEELATDWTPVSGVSLR